jgi:hypothetical protein
MRPCVLDLHPKPLTPRPSPQPSPQQSLKPSPQQSRWRPPTLRCRQSRLHPQRH